MEPTLWCILVVCASPLLVGVPVQWLLGKGHTLDESAWLQAPFLGLSVIVLVLQNLVYLDCPVATGAWILWGITLLGWLVLTARVGLRRIWVGVPVGVLAAALAVYLFHGMGLLALGARIYAGRAWWDQWHYVCLAQFVKDFPFSTTVDHQGHQVMLACPILLSHWDGRIGQSLLHAFFAASTCQTAKTLFEPTILLLPALTVLAVVALARRLGIARPRALAAAVVAGLLPSIAALHLDSFLSQALAVPLLLLIPVVLDDLHRQGGWACFLRAALVLAALLSVYGELALIVAGCLVLALLLRLGRRPFSWRPLACYAGLAALTLALNPRYAPWLLLLMERSLAAATSPNTYPWSLTLEAWCRVWFGDLAGGPSSNGQSVLRFTTVAVTALAYLGLWRGWRRAWQAARTDQDGSKGLSSFVLLSLVAALALLPVVVVLKDDQHPYQFYKLLLTVSPLLVLGLTLLPQSPCLSEAATTRSLATWWDRLGRAAVAAVPGGLVLVSAGMGTGQMIRQTANDKPTPRSFAHFMHSDALRYLQKHLQAVPAGNLVLAMHHCFLDSWMAYLGRKHRVWLYDNPEFVPAGHVQSLESQGVFAMGDLPAAVMVLTANHSALVAVSPGAIDLVWSCPFLRFWAARSRGWALPVALTAPHGAGSLAGRTFLRLGTQPTRIEMLAGGPGRLTLHGDFVPGPGTPAGTRFRVCIATSAGEQADLVTAGGPGVVTVALPAGKSVVTLRSGTPGEPGPGVGGLTLEFVPESGRDGSGPLSVRERGGRQCW